MIAVKAGHGHREVRLAILRQELRMALGATCVARGRKTRGPFVFCMARGASRCEALVGMVNRAVMTGLACFVSYIPKERSSASHVAEAALPREHRVSGSERAAGVNCLPSLQYLG